MFCCILLARVWTRMILVSRQRKEKFEWSSLSFPFFFGRNLQNYAQSINLMKDNRKKKIPQNSIPTRKAEVEGRG